MRGTKHIAMWHLGHWRLPNNLPVGLHTSNVDSLGSVFFIVLPMNRRRWGWRRMVLSLPIGTGGAGAICVFRTGRCLYGLVEIVAESLGPQDGGAVG